MNSVENLLARLFSKRLLLMDNKGVGKFSNNSIIVLGRINIEIIGFGGNGNELQINVYNLDIYFHFPFSINRLSIQKGK